MHIRMLFLFLIVVMHSTAQQKELKKIQKVLGDEYTMLPSFIGTQTDSSSEVYSRCVEDVVIGYTFQNEYIKIEDTLDHEAILPYRFGNTSYTSKAEFLEFRTWVRDSIARLKLFYGFESDEDALKLLQKDKVNYKRSEERRVGKEGRSGWRRSRGE